jgi:hypothetical protein
MEYLFHIFHKDVLNYAWLRFKKPGVNTHALAEGKVLRVRAF